MDTKNPSDFVETDRAFSRYEWEEIGEKLENFHSIFSTFWQLGKPRFTRNLPTAGVYFDRLGDCIDFNINPEFWDTLDETQKLFVIVHEVSHVLFYHGFRISGLKDQKDMKLANLALDVVVNHFITDNLGFDRDMVDPPIKPEDLDEETRKHYPEGFPKGKYCWIDTVFPEEKHRPLTGESFEYYFNLVKRQDEENEKKGKGQGQKGMKGGGKGQGMPGDSLDDHSGLDSFLGKDFNDKMQEAMSNTDKQALDQSPEIKDEAKKELDANDQKQRQQGGKQAGVGSSNSWITSKVVKVLPKRKWETVIKNWASKYLIEKVAEQWQKPHRRMINMPKDFMIPSEHEIEEDEKSRIPVWFFQDTSGSCAHLADRFFTAALSLPEDRFIVKMHCFDTRVFETDLKSKKLYGFGGTSFTCIEEYIQNQVRTTKCRYPEACFIITDGYGDRVTPEKPTRWFWFLSEQYKDCIPKECKTYDLKDFE